MKNNYKEVMKLNKNISLINIIELNFILKNLKIFMYTNKN